MKKLMAFVLLVSSAAGFTAERSIYDIMYLPSAGTSFGSTTLSLATVELDGKSVNDSESNGYNFSQSFGHSYTDRFSVEASLEYSKVENDPDGEKKYDAIKGFSDPIVTARYRIMDEDYRWDIGGGVAFSLMDKETEINSDLNLESDNLQGGPSAFIGTQFGAKTETFQWAVQALLTHNFKAETEYELGNGQDVTVEDDANNELLMRADILNKLAEKSFLRSHASVEFSESFDNDQDPAATTPPMTTYEIGTQYQHLISQDILFKAGVAYSTLNVRTGQINKVSGWVYTVGAIYQF